MKRKAGGMQERKYKRSKLSRTLTPVTAGRRKFIMPKSLIRPKQTATLRYADVRTISPGTGTVSHHIYRANSLFDPDFSGAGHQPRGYDQLAQLYANYRVKKCTLEVWWKSESTTAGIGCIAIIPGESATFDVNSQSAWLEQDNAIYRAVEGTSGSSYGYGSITVDLEKYLSLNGNDALVTTDVNANPLEGVFVAVGILGIDGQDAKTADIRVRITYEAEFSEAHSAFAQS